LKALFYLIAGRRTSLSMRLRHRQLKNVIT